MWSMNLDLPKMRTTPYGSFFIYPLSSTARRFIGSSEFLAKSFRFLISPLHSFWTISISYKVAKIKILEIVNFLCCMMYPHWTNLPVELSSNPFAMPPKFRPLTRQTIDASFSVVQYEMIAAKFCHCWSHFWC